MISADVDGLVDMAFVLGDDVQWTVTVNIDGVAPDLSGYTIRLSFTAESDGSTFDKTEADTDWIDNTDAASGQFDVIVDSTPADISTTGERYTVKAAVESGTTRHFLGSAVWAFELPPGGAYADL